MQSKDDKEVLLKDAQSKTVRIPTDNIASITEQQISLMPELVLKDVTAQDAADLLAYLEVASSRAAGEEIASTF